MPSWLIHEIYEVAYGQTTVLLESKIHNQNSSEYHVLQSKVLTGRSYILLGLLDLIGVPIWMITEFGT